MCNAINRQCNMREAVKIKIIKFVLCVNFELPLNKFWVHLLNTLQPLIRIIQIIGYNDCLSVPISGWWCKILLSKDLSLSVASVLDYRNVRCVSQSSCYLTRGGILTKKIKNCHSNALQCSRSSWCTILFYQCLDKNSAIYILTYKIYVCYTCFTDHCPKLYNMPCYTWIIS